MVHVTSYSVINDLEVLRIHISKWCFWQQEYCEAQQLKIVDNETVYNKTIDSKIINIAHINSASRLIQ